MTFFQHQVSIRTLLLASISVLLAACNTSAPITDTAPTPKAALTEPAPQAMAADARAIRPAPESKKLGTQWGEGLDSRVKTVDAQRETSQPTDIFSIGYSAEKPYGEKVFEAMIAEGRIGFSVLDSRGQAMPMYRDAKGDGSYRLPGMAGKHYQLQYRNYHRHQAYEIIASVDGVDVLTGKPASINHAGYVLKPNDTLVIEGFRKSLDEVAVFRFSAPKDSYAANSARNSINNVGVIGTAIYPLRMQNPPALPPIKPRPSPQPFPADNRFAKPPVYR